MHRLGISCSGQAAVGSLWRCVLMSVGRTAAARGMVLIAVLATVWMVLASQPAMAAQGISPDPNVKAKSATPQEIHRRMWLPKRVKLIPSGGKGTPRAAISSAVSAPPSAVSGIANIDRDPANAFSETAIALNPNGSVIMVLSNVVSQNFVGDFHSGDGASSWQSNAIRPPSSVVPSPIESSDPSASFEGNGNAVSSFISVDSNFNTFGFFEAGDTLGQFGPYTQCSGYVQGCIQFGNQPDKPFMTRVPNNGTEFDIVWDDNPANSPNSQPL